MSDARDDAESSSRPSRLSSATRGADCLFLTIGPERSSAHDASLSLARRALGDVAIFSRAGAHNKVLRCGLGGGFEIDGQEAEVMYSC